jgi:hypothetical protein
VLNANGIVPNLIDQISQLVRVAGVSRVSECSSDSGSESESGSGFDFESDSNSIDPSLRQEASLPAAAMQQMYLTGSSSTPSLFAVSDFAQAAIGVAVGEVQALRKLCWGETGAAGVDRFLASQWCKHSVYPMGWERPATWDEFAGDYRCVDGWIRLHTNAPHHRRAALSVLQNPANKAAALDAVSRWKGVELESAVVAAGGAAAYMMNVDDWLVHPQGRAVSAEPVVAWQEKEIPAGGHDAFRLSSPSRPLQGVRVLDLTRVLAGPVCTRFLASLGADVLRIDPPEWNEDGNALEMTIGKRCAGLDLNKSDDRELFESLLKESDVLVHGYRADALAKLGYDETAIATLSPSCIDVALNAYGWSGPWANRRGFDSLVQMSSGIAEFGQNTSESDAPVPLPFQALDHVTGYLMAAAIVHAVSQRVCSGRVFTARLSLARQAKLLWDICGPCANAANIDSLSHDKPASDPQVHMTDMHMANGVEQTPWGPLRRLKLPFSIEGVDTRFEHPVNKLRTSIACW